MTLGDIIKQYRTEHEMSMDAFAVKSGISKSYISLLEKNQHPKTGNPITPSVETIKSAADGMNMDFNDLFAMIDGNISLIPDTQDNCQEHHFNRETKQIAQSIYDDPDLHALFNAARGSNPDNLKLAAEMLRRMKETNNDG